MKSKAIILAAGKGTRLRSKTAKPLHKIASLPLISWVMRAAKNADIDSISVVMSLSQNDLKDTVEGKADIIFQDKQNGTGHAVLAAQQQLEKLAPDCPVIVLFADTPLITEATIVDVIATLSPSSQDNAQASQNADICVLCFDTDNPKGYGRLKINDAGDLVGIVEEADTSEAEKRITLVNGGIMAAKASVLTTLLPQLDTANAQGEIYLTDIVAHGYQAGCTLTYLVCDEEELTGVNDRVQLAQAEALMQNRLRKKMMMAGVTMINPQTVTLSFDTEIGADTIIEPNVFFGPQVKIGQNCQIKGFSHIEGAEIQQNCSIGPFARIRPGTKLGDEVKLGNFVETKNAVFAEGAKASHLSYIGDAEIGVAVNIGAGTITCNYDGVQKHQTIIEKGAFIGSNTALVAPVSIGADSIIGAGSVITQNVPSDSLALTRSPQTSLKGGTSRIIEAAKSLKEPKK